MFDQVTYQDFERLSDEDLLDMLWKVDRLANKVNQLESDDIEEVKIPPNLQLVKKKYQKKIDAIVKKLESGKITLKNFNDRFIAEMRIAFEDSYRLGTGKKILTDVDLEAIANAVQAESDFIKKFGKDIKSKKGKMSIGTRATMYGETIDSAWWAGKFSVQPDNTKIYWKLGNAEHCQGCILLSSQSPFSKRSLPTIPKSGDTPCKSHCKCHLVFVRSGKSKTDEKGDQASLTELLQVKEPGKGFRKPTKNEQQYIDRRRLEVEAESYAIEYNDLDRLEMTQAEERANRLREEIFNFMQERKIHYPRQHTLPRGQSLKDIFRNSLDGKTIELIQDNKLEDLCQHFAHRVQTFGTLEQNENLQNHR